MPRFDLSSVVREDVARRPTRAALEARVDLPGVDATVRQHVAAFCSGEAWSAP